MVATALNTPDTRYWLACPMCGCKSFNIEVTYESGYQRIVYCSSCGKEMT